MKNSYKDALFQGRALPSILLLTLCIVVTPAAALDTPIDVGPHPVGLIDGLPEGKLRNTLQACAGNASTPSDFSIGHRGAPFKFPEHTKEGYTAAAQMGAGIIECDVTFTSDQTLVCRHSQCDLHTTTNILDTALADKCSTAPDMNSGTPFSDVKCCTSDLTVAEFKSLQGKVDSGNKKAKTLQEYMALKGSDGSKFEATTGTLMTHRESIQLFRSLGVKMIPELKEPQVKMPYTGTTQQAMSQEQYAQLLVDEYIAEGVSTNDVFLQSFNLDDVLYWIASTPEFGMQAAWLDGRYRDRSFKIGRNKTWKPSMQELVESGVKILAPPMWMLLSLDADDQIVASEYAIAASSVGLDLVTWTLERSGSLVDGGGWYYQTTMPVIKNDSDVYRALHVLPQDVGVRGVFSDMPATTTFYANCLDF